VGIVLQYINL